MRLHGLFYFARKVSPFIKAGASKFERGDFRSKRRATRCCAIAALTATAIREPPPCPPPRPGTRAAPSPALVAAAPRRHPRWTCPAPHGARRPRWLERGDRGRRGPHPPAVLSSCR